MSTKKLISVCGIFAAIFAALNIMMSQGTFDFNFLDGDRTEEQKRQQMMNVHSESLAANTSATEETDNLTGAETERVAADLTQEDFYVSDGVDMITLDMLRTELVVHRELMDDPTNPMYHFVGEIYDGDYFYKLYSYRYDGIEIISSNINYEKRGRDQYIFYISQIKVSDASFDTPRGINIGSSKKEIINAYGKGEFIIENHSVSWLYYYEGKAIIFKFDEEGAVKEIEITMYKKG